MDWVGCELTISVRKSGCCGKVGHSAANQGDGSAQQPRMLNKEVVKRKEKRDCEEGRINELSLGYSFHQDSLLLAPTLGPPAPLPVAPALHCSKRDWALLNSQLVVGSWGKGFSCSCKLNSNTAHGAAFPCVALCEPGPSSEIKTCWVYPEGKGAWGNRKTLSRGIYCKENAQLWVIN